MTSVSSWRTKKKKKINAVFFLKSNEVILSIFVPLLQEGGGRETYAVFFFFSFFLFFFSFLFFSSPSSPRLRVERRERKGWKGEGGRQDPTLILALKIFLVLPAPTRQHDKLPIGHDSCFSHKHFSLIAHGLIALKLFIHVCMYVCTSRRSRGLFFFSLKGGLLRYHVTVCARLLGYCIYVSVYLGEGDLTSSSLEDFPPRGVCVCVLQSIIQSDAEN